MHRFLKHLSFVIMALILGGCATTYVPISWGKGDTVKKLSKEDLFLSALFNRYDPDRSTLRVSGASFEEVMMPAEVKFHLGAYRPDTKLIYRNLFQQYSDEQLRSVILHELAHHVWHNGMTPQQHEEWRQYLTANPTPMQSMVRSTYKPGSDFDSEDFAYAVEFARPRDIEELVQLKIITVEERDRIMKAKFPENAAPSTGKPLVRTAEGPHPAYDDVDAPQVTPPKSTTDQKDQAPQHEIY
ncbi:SprT-like domain-containing protein [Geomonas oryzisoli]|uniref:SprT-like domain-containing protein n=1 Tax=Geomonas oryzisoli TaxID=2847992 RepID=A0ABX8J5G9_9BACT|nr:SprT-like domain-containing protein [Geomonas oryzisoli]QWV93543.1 SprT-like domain-containing protein [Geomonas oryzisoli]